MRAAGILRDIQGSRAAWSGGPPEWRTSASIQGMFRRMVLTEIVVTLSGQPSQPPMGEAVAYGAVASAGVAILSTLASGQR